MSCLVNSTFLGCVPILFHLPLVVVEGRVCALETDDQGSLWLYHQLAV